jgi:phospholipid/cholesterol/gamma-HCH transport system permease protein
VNESSIAADSALTEPKTEFPTFQQRMGHRILDGAHFAGGFSQLVVLTFKELFIPPFPTKLVIEQLGAIGVESLALVVISGLATGSVMALQFGMGLARFGGTLYVPKITSLAILREMGPVFTSLLVAGRIGSGMASQIASMKVTQQIDAIRALGTSPIQRIVIPRLLACMIALPLLTLIADYIALLGAMLVAKTELNIGFPFFAGKVLETVSITDFITGMAKTMVFAFFIAITACWKGLNTEGGTEGVGKTTTWVVVVSSVFIMLADFFLTKFFFITVYPKY